MSTLHTPLRIGGTTTLRNRLYRAPVLEGAGDGDDCAETYAKHFVANAEGGVGLIIQGSACIEPEGRTSPGMTCVHTRERVMRLAPMVDAVHAAGASIWMQAGHGGLYAMEGWHQPYASRRTRPLRAPSPPPRWLSPVWRKTEVAAMSTAEVEVMAHTYGDVAAWAREAGYDGIQLASSNAKLLDQFLSPLYNRRDDRFGGSVEARALVLKEIRDAIGERAGWDFTCTVKVPVGEKAPPGVPHTTFAEGLRIAELCEEWGFDSLTPVRVSVFPDTTLSRGGVPTSLWRNTAIERRFRSAVPSARERAPLMAGYVLGGLTSPYRPVWNRDAFCAVKRRTSLPVLAVGGIRDRDEVEGILEARQADLVGIGRPFYAEPDLAARILGADADPGGLCRWSNLCVPAQMLGMKGVCYNPEVVRERRRRSPAS